MDNKKNKSMNNEMNSCGCGGGTNYAASEGMNQANAASMKNQSSDQFNNTGYKGEQSSQSQNSGMEGKTCKADTDADINAEDMDGVYFYESRSDIYELRDEAFGDDKEQKINRRLNDDIDDLTDM